MSAGDLESPVQPSTSKSLPYNQQLKQDFTRLIGTLTLTEIQREFMKYRWLDQILWMENRATSARNWHRRLRFITIVGGVILPALLTLNVKEDLKNSPYLFWGTFGISQTVAICAALEQFYNNGERWRHYRRSTESLKTQGWQFFELSGSYASYAKAGGHQEAFFLFSTNVEEIIQHDVEIYSTKVIQEKKDAEAHKHAEE